MEGKIRAAIYARVSTADGRQDTENQFAELRRFGEVQGWVIVGEYTDHESGGKAERAELRRMFTDAAQRKYDVVVVWSLDRLTREGPPKPSNTSSDSLPTAFSLLVSPKSTFAQPARPGS